MNEPDDTNAFDHLAEADVDLLTGTQTPELWGPAEVKNALAITGVTLKRYRDSGKFPAPRWELSIGPIWLADEVRRWAEDRKRDADEQERERMRRHVEAVRIYRRTGSVMATARNLGASRSSVIEWLKSADEPMPRERDTK